MDVDKTLRSLEAAKANAESWIGIGLGLVSFGTGFIPGPVGQAISKASGYLSIVVGAAAILDGCAAYLWDGICWGELTSLWMVPTALQVTSLGAPPMAGIPGIAESLIWQWAEQSRGPIPELH